MYFIKNKMFFTCLFTFWETDGDGLSCQFGSEGL